MNNFDCIVIGYGPCGVSTAVYLKRYGYSVGVIGKDNGALEKAKTIENYYGFSSISGTDLLAKGLEQLKQFQIPLLKEEVLEINAFEGFEIITKEHTYHSKALMLAVGCNRSKMPASVRFEGSGVSYCATCDGFFFRKKKVGIIGSGAYMKHELDVLKKMIPDITIFTNGEELGVELEDGQKVVKDKITSFNGDLHLESITAGDITYPIDGCFIALGSASGFTLAKHLGLALDGDSILVDEAKMTNIPGLFAGGDCIGGLLQVSKAVSDGAVAATSISKYLKTA